LSNPKEAISGLKKEYKENSYLSKKHKIFDVSREKLNNDLDIISFLLTVREFQRFKEINFDLEQRALFESVTNPTIMTDDVKRLKLEKKALLKEQQTEGIAKNYSNSIKNSDAESKKLSGSINKSFTKRIKTKINDGTTTMLKIDFNEDNDVTDLKNIKYYDSILTTLSEGKKLDLLHKKLLMNLGVDVNTIVNFNHLIEQSRDYKKTKK